MREDDARTRSQRIIRGFCTEWRFHYFLLEGQDYKDVGSRNWVSLLASVHAPPLSSVEAYQRHDTDEFLHNSLADKDSTVFSSLALSVNFARFHSRLAFLFIFLRKRKVLL